MGSELPVCVRLLFATRLAVMGKVLGYCHALGEEGWLTCLAANKDRNGRAPCKGGVCRCVPPGNRPGRKPSDRSWRRPLGDRQKGRLSGPVCHAVIDDFERAFLVVAFLPRVTGF
ncbi:MAG: hypothetical protein ABFS45_25660, partial [Pseudomonadota bacterium]